MTDSGKPCCTDPKAVLWTLGLFALFGFLALILTGQLGSKSPENRAYQGVFPPERTAERWANLEEVKSAQSALLDEAKVSAALQALAKSPAKPETTDLVVPGSPTFLKQMEQAAAAEAKPAEAKPAPAAEVKPAEAKPAEAKPESEAKPAAPAAPAKPDAPAPAPVK